ncbi:MAG: hypothetical protein ACRDGF_02790 [Chloroflexota bacterium]
MVRFVGLTVLGIVFVMAVVPAVLSVAGAFLWIAPWVLIGTACWAIMGRGPRRHRLGSHYWHSSACDGHSTRPTYIRPPQQRPDPWGDNWWAAPRSQARPAHTRPVPAAQPATPPAKPAPTLPAELQAQVDHVRASARELQQRMTGVPRLSVDLYLLDRITQDYLPRTIDSFLAIPEANRARSEQAGGKTAADELGEQLALLQAKLADIASNLHQHDLDRLLANRRFLEERLNGQPEPLPADGSSPTTAEPVSF